MSNMNNNSGKKENGNKKANGQIHKKKYRRKMKNYKKFSLKERNINFLRSKLNYQTVFYQKTMKNFKFKE